VCVVGEKSSHKSGRVVYLLAVTRPGHDGRLFTYGRMLYHYGKELVNPEQKFEESRNRGHVRMFLQGLHVKHHPSTSLSVESK